MACALDSDAAEPTMWPSRLAAGGVLSLCLALLVGAARLEPDPAGLGTHVQLGLADCAWRAGHGAPCPTCGMTTAVALAAEGRLVASFVTQPAGALLALMTAMTGWVALFVLLTGRDDAWRWLRRLLWRRWTLIAAALIVVAAWVYKLAVA